ncbi:MAG: hypothetical protein ACQESP_00225 [Candidatus Muiribacteriota bacterium]
MDFRRLNFIFLFAFLTCSILIFITGFTQFEYNTGQRILVIYPEVSQEGHESVISYYMKFMEKSLIKLGFVTTTPFYLDLYLQKNNLKPGNPIELDNIHEIALESDADIVIYTSVYDYDAHRGVRLGLALLEPALNTSITGSVKMDTQFYCVNQKKIVDSFSVERETRNRLFGMVTLKKYLMQRTIRNSINEVLYLAQKKDII